MSIELKPCPFCGSDSITNHDTLIGYSVGCDKCGAVAAHCATKAESISAWNTRTAIQKAESESLTDTFVQTVPDKCDRILWRGRYLHLPIPYPAPGVPDDSKRLDYLQDRGATIDLVPGVAGFYPMRFRVGVLHSSASIDVRAAIDAAMLAASPE